MMMTTPTLDEQIAAIKFACDDALKYDESDITIPREDVDAILASLQELDRIRKVKVPEPPERVVTGGTTTPASWYAYADALLDLLRRETVRADRNGKMSQGNYELYKRTVADLTKAEAELAALRKDAKGNVALVRQLLSALTYPTAPTDKQWQEIKKLATEYIAAIDAAMERSE